MTKKIQASETNEQIMEEKNQKLKVSMGTAQRSHGLVETAPDADAIIACFDSDPDPPPKKPSASYIVYTNKLRAKVMEENPTLSSNDDISNKKLGKIWRAVPAAEKQALFANYSKEYYVYRQKMKEWQIRNPERGRLLRSQQWRLRYNLCGTLSYR